MASPSSSPEEMAPPSQPPAHVRVGIGVLVRDPRDPSRVFAGTRIGSHGAGTVALPGGHLEMYETWEGCARREVREETGLAVHNVRFGHVTNDPMEAEGRHYVTVFMTAECVDREAAPENCEPHKCEGWDSYSWEDLRKMNAAADGEGRSLFGPLRRLVEEEPELVKGWIGA